MKKYLSFALALPLLFACSSEDFTEKEVISNDPFAGIEKVDATFSMDEGTITRMDNGSWTNQENDVWGFAWMTDDHTATTPYTPLITIDGKAYQNHNLIQKSGRFEPQTSIYVGKYYLYRPYDETVVSPEAIHFNSLKEQPLADGYASTTDAWKNLAKTAINIGDKFTEVTPTGTTDAEGTWNDAGIKKHYRINGAFFSNQTGLDLTYQNNNVEVPAAGMTITGATDIDYKYPAGRKIGAADIYKATVQLTGAPNSFTYAPTAEPNSGTHAGTFWADKKDLNTTGIGGGTAFTWESGAGFDVITLKAAGENGVSTDKTDNKGWFWFNSLPITAGTGDGDVVVVPILETSYGQVTVNKSYSPDVKYTVKDCAYAGNVESGVMVWHPLANTGDASKNPSVWAIGSNNTFINQYGNHKGKFALTVDFSKGVMNGMHIKNDTHLQKLLKFYIASGKTEPGVVLNLDKDADGVFKISKLSIALLQTIGGNVKVQACTVTEEKPSKIIVTQDGQADLGLADKKEVPALNNVFAVATNVYLSSDCEWTWAGGSDAKTALTIDANVTAIVNEGKLTVNATNVETSPKVYLWNAAGATMDITKVTTVKNDLYNAGTINVGSESITTAELRAYGKEVRNEASTLTKHGVINNYGVVGVTLGTSGKFNNYGLIEMKNNDAITLLTNNATSDNAFGSAFDPSSNKMGTVILPEGNPYAIVSVSNTAENGFIKYKWNETTYTHDPLNVKYNTIVVSKDITFTGDAATEVQYIEFNGTKTKVVNPSADNKLTALKGIIVNAGKSIIIEKTNSVSCSVGSYLGEGATIYLGGAFGGVSTNNYFGTWSNDQIVVY